MLSLPTGGLGRVIGALGQGSLWGEGGVIPPWAGQGSPEVSHWAPDPAPTPPALAAVWALPVGSCSHPELRPDLGPRSHLPAGQRLSSRPPLPWGPGGGRSAELGGSAEHMCLDPAPGEEGQTAPGCVPVPEGEGAGTRG